MLEFCRRLQSAGTSGSSIIGGGSRALWVAQGSRNNHKRIWARVSAPELALVRRVRQQRLFVSDALEMLLVLCELTHFHVQQGYTKDSVFISLQGRGLDTGLAPGMDSQCRGKWPQRWARCGHDTNGNLRDSIDLKEDAYAHIDTSIDTIR